MNNKPTALDYLAQEVARLSAEKAMLQQALYEAQEQVKELSEKEKQEGEK